jgi:hypothetical protein
MLAILATTTKFSKLCIHHILTKRESESTSIETKERERNRKKISKWHIKLRRSNK